MIALRCSALLAPCRIYRYRHSGHGDPILWHRLAARRPCDAATWVISLLLAVVYVALVWVGRGIPAVDDPNAPVVHLPETKPTVIFGFALHPAGHRAGLVFDGGALVAGLSAFWATMLMVFILLTQSAIVRVVSRRRPFRRGCRRGYDDLVEGLIAGARNMIGIGIATATAGIIVGAVSQTGVGLVLADLVEILSLGNILLMLILTAVLSLILGMGLPTTANYIVVSSLLAPVIVTLGEQSGLIVPLIAVHLFVFSSASWPM